MGDINPDHLKYMPHASEETTEPDTSAVSVAEEIIVESTEETPVRDIEENIAGQTVDKEDIHAADITDKNLAEKREKEDELSRTLETVSNSALAGFIYGFFSPLVVPTIAALFIFLLSLLIVMAPGAALPYTLTVFGATCLLPGTAIYILYKTGFIHTLRLTGRTERIIPYVIEFLVLGAMAIFFICKGGAPWIWTVFCGGAAIALVNMAINFRMRISNHCSSIAALLAVLIVIQTYGLPPFPLFWWVAGTAFFTGVIGSLSIIRGRHTLAEVLAGYATGFLGIILFSLIH